MKGLRIYVSKDKHDVYTQLVNRNSDYADSQPFHTMKDLFLLAACLGFKYDSVDKLDSPKDIFYADLFDSKTDKPLIAAIAFAKTKDISVLLDEKKMLEIVQEYANGGIDYVVQEIMNTPGKRLDNYIELINDHGKV